MIYTKLRDFLRLIIFCIAISISVYGNDLEDALTNGSIKVQLKSHYFTREHNEEPSESIWVNGASINYTTKPFFSTVAGITLQTSRVTDKQVSDAEDSKFQSDMYANGAVFSEAYIAPTISNTTLKFGRQYIHTPLVYGSRSRIVQQSFQGATLTTEDIPNSTISIIHLDKYQARTDNGGGIGEFTKKFDYIGLLDGVVTLDNGANSLFIKNNSIKDLTLTYQYLDAKNFAKTNFVNATYDFGTPVHLKATLQQFSTSWDSDASEAKSGYLNLHSAKMRGYELEAIIKGIKFAAAYSQNDTDGDVLGGLGLVDALVTASIINGGGYLQNNSARKFSVFTNIYGVNVYIGKTIYKNKDNIYRSVYGAHKYTESDFMVSYNFTKNLNVNFVYAKFGGNVVGAPNFDSKSRVKLTYTF